MQLPKSKFLLAALVLSASFDSSTAQSPEDFRIVEVYNQYFFAIRSPEVCDNQPFKSVDEEQKFKNNFVKVRVEAANALRRNKPNFTTSQIVANMKFMDDNTTAAIEKAHRVEGCKGAMISQGLKWHQNFRSMPEMK